MKYHVENGCARNYESSRLSRAQFVNTLSSQRCGVCERMAFGGSVHRANLVAAGEMIEAREGETMRLSHNGAEIIRKIDYDAHCMTNPNDRISLRANITTEYVMLTAHQTHKTACIDLSPAIAREFAEKLISAANLIDGKTVEILIREK